VPEFTLGTSPTGLPPFGGSIFIFGMARSRRCTFDLLTEPVWSQSSWSGGERYTYECETTDTCRSSESFRRRRMLHLVENNDRREAGLQLRGNFVVAFAVLCAELRVVASELFRLSRTQRHGGQRDTSAHLNRSRQSVKHSSTAVYATTGTCYVKFSTPCLRLLYRGGLDPSKRPFLTTIATVTRWFQRVRS
jgi:hypothetical protein